MSLSYAFRWKMLATLAVLGLSSLPLHAQSGQEETIRIDAREPARPFPHFWERMFGSGRAVLSLREDYRRDLRAVKRVTALGYVRFHGIFDDDLGVYTEDEHGAPVYNFTLVDQVYDGLLAEGVRPLVEIGFMPRRLAFNPDALHPFWYKPNVSAPKDYARWDALVRAFAEHLLQRYGSDEVAQWYFEVWNEPNIDFWVGAPRQRSYFELYDHTARALKSVSARLRVGGPATAAAAWVDAFLAHAAREHVPVDFVSTHGYASDREQDLFGDDTPVPPQDRVCRAVAKVHRQIAASPRPGLPLLWTEWNVLREGGLRDTIYVGPALADTVRACDGLVDAMSFWTFSDIIDEQGPNHAPFAGLFGLRAIGGIDKPSYYAFALLHELGEQRLPHPSPHAIVTRRTDGSLAIVLWHLVNPGEDAATRRFRLEVTGLAADAVAVIRRVDAEHGNALAVYERLGRPRYPTPAQVAQINAATALVPERRRLTNGVLTLTLGPNALVQIMLSSGRP